MDYQINPYNTQPDIVVLENLIQDVRTDTRGNPCAEKDKIPPELIEKHSDQEKGEFDHDKQSIALLKAYNNPERIEFAPTVFTSWDDKDLPGWVNSYIVKPYTRLATRIVRHPTDVVFLTHILQYMTINLGSAVCLYLNFSYIHGLLHTVYTVWCAGSFTLVMHQHIHGNGVLSKDWAWLDWSFPYVLEPLMGHTWDSYYYHHTKHHHVESNGPDDLSSTIRYQRDDVLHFLHYYLRFLLFCWAELPLYFIKKGKTNLALRAFCSEMASYVFLYCMTKLNPRASTFVLLLPFALLRFALMSNRFCFNDGYHTAHHLNPRRHWREHPVHFLQSKAAYRNGRALVFHDIDYLMMTVRLLRKDYMHLAGRLVPMGDQIGMSQVEIAEMLRRKTRRFTEEEIQSKFR
ncbi:uncharacterized protein LTR77_000598 [Saxophila tyrrhenica]|uniref:Fatty acid desaturase domain-containing protein n=1 Tax=Saxophila tyrrhenica TaxID=1690608 RepID=A0AAV9PN44_9PEZI|nr:hypothetical protein LTR77_000598 [Saxophila tyrrhenica]